MKCEIYISTSTSGWVTTSRWIVFAMKFLQIGDVPADIGSDISDIGLTQPCTTSTWISFKWVLTIPVVSSWTQTMENVRRVLVVFVTRVVHVTKVLWTSQLNAGYIIAASSTNPCLRDFLVRGIWILSSMASFPPAIPSARFVDNLKLKCESNICEAQSPCPEACWMTRLCHRYEKNYYL